MEALSLTEIQEGNKRWVLAGQKADFHKDRMEVSIQGVQVDFYRLQGEHLRVKAQEGLLNTKTRVLTLKGQVELESGDTVVKTGLATYLPAERVLVVPDEVILENPRLRVQGKELRVELATRKMTLARHQLTEVKTLAWKPQS
jgi:LPS export ABC transporter protein LptC